MALSYNSTDPVGNRSILETTMKEDANHSSSESHFLEQNCREDWPRWACIVGNVAGLCSTTLWFLVLLPQVWKNFRRKSVRGLSVLWATANFTASLVNLFFVFLYVSIPLYGQISSIYCPILEFTLLVQFWMYGHYRMLHKGLYVCACLVAWGGVIAVELLLSVEGTVEYVAIGLWCVETFPQVILNMKLQTTSGQSFGSVFIAMLGKTTDFIGNNALVLPLQYVIMTYFSSSVAYVNGLQVAWYYGNDIDNAQPMGDKDSETNTRRTQSKQSLVSQQSYGASKSLAATLAKRIGFRRVSPATDTARILGLCLLMTLLTICVVGFVWNIQSYYGLFAPASIALVLVTTRAYLNWYRKAEYSIQGRDVQSNIFKTEC